MTIGAALLFSLLSVSCGLTRGSNTTPAPKTDTTAKAPTTTKPEKPKKTKTDLRKDSLDLVFPTVKKDRYVIAVYLPLYLESEDRDTKHKGEISIATDFYRGLLVGVDTMKKCGLNLDIHVFDSESELNTLSAVKSKLTSIDADLIIGPLLEGKMTFIDTLAESLKINHVSPLLPSDKCSSMHNYYFESTPGSDVIADSVAHMIDKMYPGYNRILVNETQTKDNDLAQAFSSHYHKDSLMTIDFRNASPANYEPVYNLEEKNIIIVTSRSQIFVSSLMTQLLKNEQEIIVVGTLPWTFFKTIDGDTWEKFKFHIPAQYFIDYQNTALNPFIEAYRAKYRDEPSAYTFFGFDEMVYFAQSMQKDGKYFQRPLFDTPVSRRMLHTTYSFERDTKCGAWRNNHVNMLRFENYELRPIPSIQE